MPNFLNFRLRISLWATIAPPRRFASRAPWPGTAMSARKPRRRDVPSYPITLLSPKYMARLAASQFYVHCSSEVAG